MKELLNSIRPINKEIKATSKRIDDLCEMFCRTVIERRREVIRSEIINLIDHVCLLTKKISDIIHEHKSNNISGPSSDTNGKK